MRIIANTFPKSGTGLLRQMLTPCGANLGHISQFYGDTGKEAPATAVKAALAKMGEGFVTAHLHFRPEYLDLDATWIFLYRDPRDVAVSHPHYILADERHSLHPYYKGKDIQECIKMSIAGIPGVLPDIGQRFLPYVPWLHSRDVLPITYEYLKLWPLAAAGELADWVDRPGLAPEMVEAIHPERSATFRQGRVGGWMEEMSEENCKLFDHVAGWLVEMLEYAEPVQKLP